MTLSEMLAGRSNPKKKRKKRKNASPASSGLSFRSALRKSRKNSASKGLSLRDALRQARKNEDENAESIYAKRATDAIARLEAAQDKAQSGLTRDLKALARAQKAVDKILAQGGASRNRIKKALAALEGKSPKKRKTTRKKRKTSSRKSKKRTNPMTTRTNPKRKKRRSPSVSTSVLSLMKKNSNYKKTPASKKNSNYKKTPASKKKKFEAEFKKNYRKLKKSKVSVAQAAARASFAAARSLEVGPVSKRRNPTTCSVRSNPKRRKTTTKQAT
jgi:hypothetical protein